MYEVTNEDLTFLLTDSFEGGSQYIGYWADLKDGYDIRGMLERGETINVYEYDESTGKAFDCHELTRAKLVSGIERAAEHYGRSVQAFVEDYDCETADVAIQFAVLDEIRYG